MLIVYMKDPYATGERSTRSPESQLDSAGIHPSQIRPAASSGTSTRRRILRRQKAGLLFHKGDQHRGTVLVFRTRGTMSLQRAPRGKCRSSSARH